MKRRPPLGFCLAVSHVDVESAKLWLRWATYLSTQSGGKVTDLKLLVMLTKRVSARDELAMQREIDAHARTFFDAVILRCPDEDERGYPGSSSHLFCRSLQAFNELLSGFAMMFCEADSAPTRATWARELCAEYQRHSAPFIGLHIPSTDYAVSWYGMPAVHLTGNAMYPPNAIKLAPTIESCLVARTDNCPWGEKGWAWDLFCAHEIIPLSEQTTKIQQIWRSDPWSTTNLNRLSRDAALFHQSKDGSFIASVALRDHPKFIANLPVSGHCFMLETGQTSMVIGDRTIQFIRAARGIGGRWLCICHPTDPIDDMLLNAHAGRAGLSRITPAEYSVLAAQAARNRLD